ncbi:hypothetical protein QL285_034416 [Trifolium repens]|jgi:hypothetical protein|nr:hypothetical protein QL285_034416 [Trifolium repens]
MTTPYEKARRKTMEENSKRMEALNLLGFSQSLRKSSSTTLKPSLPSNNPFLFLRSVRVGRLVSIIGALDGINYLATGKLMSLSEQ